MTIEEFYRDNYRIVYGYLLSLSGNAAVAEELASETFLRALQKPPHDQGACKPSTWLCAIAKNLYFSELRRQKRRVPFPDAAPQDTVPFEERLVDVKRRVPCSMWQRNCGSPTGRCFFCGFPGSPSAKSEMRRGKRNPGRASLFSGRRP